MRTNQLTRPILAMMLLLSIGLSSCASPAATPASSAGPAATKEPVTVRVSILPVLESLPTYVADAQGYFAEAGIKVQYVPVASSAERDQLLMAGQLDAGITDMVSTALMNKNGPVLVIVRFGRVGSTTFPTYRILAAKDSGIRNVQDLRGVQIAVSQATVIQYVTERMLEGEGFKPDEIQEINVPSIADRMSVLSSGAVKAATIPDPLASLAIQQGAYVVVDDTKYPQLGNSAFDFTKAFIDQHPEAVRAFLQATERAVIDINRDKSKWNSILQERKLMSPSLIGTYTLPDFPLASVPSKAQWADVIAWEKSKNLITTDIPYETSVSAAYLPAP